MKTIVKKWISNPNDYQLGLKLLMLILGDMAGFEYLKHNATPAKTKEIQRLLRSKLHTISDHLTLDDYVDNNGVEFSDADKLDLGKLQKNTYSELNASNDVKTLELTLKYKAGDNEEITIIKQKIKRDYDTRTALHAKLKLLNDGKDLYDTGEQIVNLSKEISDGWKAYKCFYRGVDLMDIKELENRRKTLVKYLSRYRNGKTEKRRNLYKKYVKELKMINTKIDKYDEI